MGSSKDENKGETVYKKRAVARIRDLIYYLGEGWVDIGEIGNNANTEKYRNIGTSNYQPKKCPLCKKYWHLYLDSNKISNEYLRDSIFKNIPVDKEKCWNC
tara:strand:+ start:19351 stop:19653 length:303 start_codon:yes stop_codon:yes gene_type:complete